MCGGLLFHTTLGVVLLWQDAQAPVTFRWLKVPPDQLVKLLVPAAVWQAAQSWLPMAT